MMMSASLSLKMMRMTMTVTETGSISGKITPQNCCQRLAPSTRLASITSRSRLCRPASSMIIMKGMKVQASSIMIVARAMPGVPKKDGLSQPRWRARRATGPKRGSSIDLPTIHESATGESISGIRKATRQNLRAAISAERSSARPKAMAYSARMASTYQTMLRSAFQ